MGRIYELGWQVPDTRYQDPNLVPARLVPGAFQVGGEVPLSIPLVLGGLFWIASMILRKPKSGWTR